MPYVQAGDSRLYYETHGDGESIVFLHGVGGNHASWFRQVAAFRSRYRVVVFDARGFGNSVDVEQLGRSAFVSDLELLLDELRISRACLVAQSMGGGTAALFTCRHPDRVRALVLADTLVGIEVPASMVSTMKARAEANRQLPQLQRVLGATFREREPAMAQLYLELASFNRVTHLTLQGVQQTCTPEQLAASGAPILFVVGREDVLFPPAAVRALHELVPGSAYEEIPGAGHSAYFENPDGFNACLAAFLQQRAN
jgi:3-oxoadipate enol-lactonase